MILAQTNALIEAETGSLLQHKMLADAAASPTISTGMSTSARRGKMLTCTGTRVNDGATLLYRASKYDCDACSMKSRCCPKIPARKVPRSIYESARDRARDIAKTDEGRASRKLRKKVEMLFAHPKRILRLDWLQLRGDEWGARCLERQFYDLSAPEDPPFGSIAAMIAAWTFLSCAATAAVSDNRRCRVS